MKIKLKNFQSARCEEVEFNPGLTLITGPTDNGKTSIFRAILALLTNPAEAASFINGAALKEKGEDAELVVTLIDDDIPKIEFHRTKSKAWYIIDGKKYSKLARSNIFDIYPELHKKFVYVPEDPRKVLNFQTEDQLAFPFDRSESEMFKLFERIFNIADTRAIIDTMKKEEDEINFKLNQNKAEKLNLEDEILRVSSELGKINKELILNYLNQLKLKSHAVNTIQAKIQSISAYAPLLKVASELPQLSSVNGEEELNKVLELEKKLEACEQKQKFISNYIHVELSNSEKDESIRVSNLLSKINSIQNLNQKQQEQEALIEIATHEMQEAQLVLSKFNSCPLCGQEIRKDLEPCH